MRKILIVGCGGSGGSTLAYMMDQLKAELAPYGIRKLPGGWQFVHVDVPRVVDTKGIPSVPAQGGGYIATAPAVGANYAAVDTKVSDRVAAPGMLPFLGTWLPREPEKIWTPVSDGAGQLRAVGRALTLSEVGAVQSGLHAAWDRMSISEAETEMHEVARVAKARFGEFAPNAQPLVLVVSSMAGGAGASMALDVCRLLTTIPTLDPGLMGVFMFSPDIFDSLDPQSRAGVRANGLAMLGEIVASQTRAAGPHDAGVLRALGTATDPARVPFARVFPVGRTMGVNGALFGDGSMSGVYRGLGRGLAALIASDAAMHQLTTFDLINSNPTPTNQTYFGWGETPKELQWGSFGYAALSLGRDRYRHYAAQRLARAAVDRLIRGHRNAHDTASDEVQLTNLVESQWQGILGRLDLPADGTPQSLFRWYTSRAFSQPAAHAAARAVLDVTIAARVPEPAGMEAQQWLHALSAGLGDKRAEIRRAISDAAYRWAFEWAPRFMDAVVDEVASAVARFGLPYARAVLDRVRALVENQLLPGFVTLSEYPVGDPATVPPAVATPLASMRGVVTNPEEMKRLLWEGMAAQMAGAIHAGGAEAMSRILGSGVSEGLIPLREALGEALVLAVKATEETAHGVGLADVETAVYGAWPSGTDARVPDRFDVAHNEILLTPASGFDVQYSADVRASVSDAYGEGYEEAQSVLVTQVISGIWPAAAGEEPPGGLLSRLAPWRAAYFNTDPVTGTGLTPSRAAYRFNLSTTDVLNRATAFVARRGETFDRYCSVSLKEFAGGQAVPASVLQERHDLIVTRFREALNAARPLSAVSEQAVVAVHGEGVAYRYKLSKIPFASIPSLGSRLREVVESWPSIDSTARDAFDGALVDDDDVAKIDVFGSYKCYSPVVFSGLLEPVKEQWGALPSYARETFWQHRRSRPLTAALPVGDDERRVMVAGWYVGRITGRIRVPGSPYTEPVRIWQEEDERWLDFPHPLLTPPDQFLGGAYDWLPAVLESMLIAVAQAHNPPILGSLAAYRALRETFDDSANRPVSGLAAVPSGQRILSDWLRDGVVPTGGANVFSGAKADERADLVKAWLRTQTADVREKFGVAVGRRVDAARLPIFRDLAEDAVWALERIAEMVDPALRDASAVIPEEVDFGMGNGVL